VEENIFVIETHQAARGVVNFYSAVVVTHGRRIYTFNARVVVGYIERLSK
jgi:hypothetical protein